MPLCRYGSFTAKMRKDFDKLYLDPVEEIERRQLIAAGLPTRETTDQLRRRVIEETRIDLPIK